MLMVDSPKNIFKENTSIKNTSSKNIIKHTLRVYLVVILESIFDIFNI